MLRGSSLLLGLLGTLSLSGASGTWRVLQTAFGIFVRGVFAGGFGRRGTKESLRESYLLTRL